MKLKALLVLMMVLLSLSSCSKSPDNDQLKKDNLRREVIRFAEKNNADVKWVKLYDIPNQPYTIEVQKAILEPTPKKLLFVANISDVKKQEESFLIFAESLLPNINVQLSCTKQQAEIILHLSKGNFRALNQYAIIFFPKSVHKPFAGTYGIGDSGTTSSLVGSGDSPMIQGECIDILPLGEAGFAINRFTDYPVPPIR